MISFALGILLLTGTKAYAAVSAAQAKSTVNLSSLSLADANGLCRKALDAYQCPSDTLLICQRAVEIAQKELDGTNLIISNVLNNLAECYLHGHNGEQAEFVSRQGLNIRLSVLGKEHTKIAESLATLAVALQFQGKYVEAEDCHRRALAMQEKFLGREHKDVASTLNNLATLLVIQGKYSDAEKLHGQALVINQKILGAEHPEVALNINVLAIVLKKIGKLEQAESRFRLALAMRQKILGKDHPHVAISMNGLASVLDDQGKYAEAEALFRQALELSIKRLGPEHVHVAINLSDLANVLTSQERFEQAEELSRQALSMLQKLLGSEHPQVAATLNSLIASLNGQRKYEEAEKLARWALAIRQKQQQGDHPSVAISLNNLGLVLDRRSQHGAAEELYHQALAMMQKHLGSDHPSVATCLNNLARNFILQSKPMLAVPLFHQSLKIREEQSRNTVSEIRMRALLESIHAEEDTIYGLVLGAHAQGIHDLALRLALLRKGRVSEAGALANRLIQRNMRLPSVKQLFEKWRSVLEQREFLLFEGLGKLSPAQYHGRLQELKNQGETLEHALAIAVPELRNVQPPSLEEIIPQVAKHLPPNGALVEVVSTKPFLGYSQPDKREWGNPRYLALLLFPDQRIESVDLGDAASLDGLIATFGRALGTPSSDPKPAAQALHSAVFDKLKRHLVGRKDIYLSLDSALQFVPFDALHDGADYLLGSYRFHYLSSGRDLLRKPSTRAGRTALVVGNPYFGAPREPTVEAASSFDQELASLSQLPGAQREAETVGSLIGVRAITGAAATEDQLRARLAPTVLHLATHTLLLKDLKSWQLPGERSAILALRRPDESPPAHAIAAARLPGEFGRMNRSALLFAGVRQGVGREDKDKDGLLTAEEARSLDMDGTQLVVLSACDTGRGEMATGQGVYGLRRAFLIAGAETVVTSLWRVDDEATGELMQLYYRKLLDRTKPGDRLGAMLESMQELRARPNRRHPYYWAPFLVLGQDGPLRLRQISTSSGH